MAGWTWKEVEAAVKEAADTLRRLPGERPGGFKSCMPEPLRDAADVWANAVEAGRFDDLKINPGPPSRASISRLDIVLTWMVLLGDDEVKVIWARAVGMGFPAMARRFGCSRHAAWQRHSRALIKLAVQLNSKKEPQMKIAC